jgi:DNA polymerase I-like protein with 3'-5' exonuclease and polymerase domains
MGPERATQVINKDSDKPPFVTVTLGESKEFNRKWHEYYNLKIWWSEVERKLNDTRSITTTYGRARTFFGNWGTELFKEATAYEPQSTVADHFNGCLHPELRIEGGLLTIYRRLIKGRGDRKIVNQSHDSFIAEIPSGDLKDFAEESRSLLLRPVIVNNETFTIPVDVEAGERWGYLEKVT